jgi:hypothetical protein
MAREKINLERNFEKQNNLILRDKEGMKLTVWMCGK